jgi:acetylornithine deacetylase/succinyl-diaminopimelate desuccinylase-like protein
MRRFAVSWLALVVLLTSTASAQTSAVDWDKHKTETLAHYRALVQIDSSNPPGNETRVVEYLKKVLEAEGIPTRTFALDPQRANLVARLTGNGSKRPLLILAHTDVVGVQREKWPVDPFAAVMKDGYVWGRGTVDDKPVLAANLMVMLLLKRGGVPLDRDVIFLAESGEEADLTGVGINFMVNQHFGEIDAEFALTEGGGATLVDGRVTRVSIGTAEKVPARVRLVAKGTSGHGSVPRADNANVHLAAAVHKAGTWETPMRLNDTTRAYFKGLAAISSPAEAARYNALLDPQRPAAAQRYLAEHEPAHYAMLRTSVVPTMLKAGVSVNTIPSEAEAILDIRALPGEDVAEFHQELKRVIGDPAIEIVPLPATRPPSPASRLDTEMYRVLEEVSRRIYPGSTVLPSMSTGASDQAQLRAKGIQSYGIGPAATESDRLNFGAHSDVERLLESSLYAFVEFTWAAVTAIAVSKPAPVALSSLTVPEARLPAGCRLKPADPATATSTRGDVIRAAPFGPRPPTNPWAGSDRGLAAGIRQRIEGPTQEPDAPPLDRRAANAYRMKWADNVVEAYWAIYQSADGSPIDVRAVRFSDPDLADPGPPPGTRSVHRGAQTRLVVGSSVVLISGSRENTCHTAIADYIRSLR